MIPAGLGKTPWVDRTWKLIWDKVSKAVTPEWLPLFEASGVAKEYGCGLYGCVMPTRDPSVVVKFTSDPTEAAFVAAAIKVGEFPEGIVKYFDIKAISGVTRRNRPVFVLWRSAVDSVGLSWKEHRAFVENVTLYSRAATSVLLLLKKQPGLLHEYKKHEEYAWNIVAESIEYEGDEISLRERVKINPNGVTAARRIAVNLRLCDSVIEWMENTYGQHVIGEALSFYREVGFVFGDLHVGNFGYVNEKIVISDPGHAAPIRPELFSIRIDEL